MIQIFKAENETAKLREVFRVIRKRVDGYQKLLPLNSGTSALKRIKKLFRRFNTMWSIAIKEHGSRKKFFRQSLMALRDEGLKGVYYRFKKYENLAKVIIPSARSGRPAAKPTDLNGALIHKFNTTGMISTVCQPNVNVDIITGARLKSTATILFIGHDSRLAGAQVLLLSLIKWLHEHTSFTLKIILIESGILYEQYNKIVPALVWEELIRDFPDKETRRAFVRQFTGSIGLIYGNTVVAPSIYDELDIQGIPVITHVHELEKSIKLYIDQSTLKKMHKFTRSYIACSSPVGENLLRNHGIPGDIVEVIHAFIEEKNLNENLSKRELRRKLGLQEEGLLVLNCGTCYWRKGSDLFIETAAQLKKSGLVDFHFYWLGELYWDFDSASLSICSWADLEKKITLYGLNDHVSFLGVTENVYDYYQACDVFYLSSREDPFPLVCLEAAQSSMPVICFADAGGMPGFVESDAGFVVPFEDTVEAARSIRYLYDNHSIIERIGEQARKKFLQRHSVSKAAPAILKVCRRVAGINPAVSVIVPNYNGAQFLRRRLDSILNQTFCDLEVIIFDDASTDGSLEIIEEYLNHPCVRLKRNIENSGNPFRQWQQGFMESRAGIVWIAEADDYCESVFLQKLLPFFNDPYIALAYCNSHMVDEQDALTGDYSNYYGKIHPDRWDSSYVAPAGNEINQGLGIKNTIPNASAVLIRKSCVHDSVFDELNQYSFCGDWYFYTQVIKNRLVAYCPEKLNFHRKHGNSITAMFNSQKADGLLRETGWIHGMIAGQYPIFPEFVKHWEFYVNEQVREFHTKADKKEFYRFYPYEENRAKILAAVEMTIEQKRMVFITTNDHSADGGSEKLWRLAAIEAGRRGYQVMTVIKKWDPEPFFIRALYDAGVQVVYKESDHFARIIGFKPDRLVISLSDQDEGVDYFEQCLEYGIPYVIVNHLTKEPKYWPLRLDILDRVRKGYLGADRVLFTGKNNQLLMEKRLDCSIPRTGIFYNPFDVDRDTVLPFPDMKHGLKLACPANLLHIHKGQNLAIELFGMKKWRERPVHLNFYGEGPDEAILRQMAKEYRLANVTFHGHTSKILDVWRDNHAIFLSSYMEGMPLVTVGAMLCSRVPVVTDVGAHREIIDDNISGFLATTPSVEALDEAFERAYRQSARWELIGKEARRKILEIIPADPIDDFINKIQQ